MMLNKIVLNADDLRDRFVFRLRACSLDQIEDHTFWMAEITMHAYMIAPYRMMNECVTEVIDVLFDPN